MIKQFLEKVNKLIIVAFFTVIVVDRKKKRQLLSTKFHVQLSEGEKKKLKC